VASNTSPGLNSPALPTAARPFGYKTAWLAIRGSDSSVVAAALDLHDLQSANWEYGVWHATEADYRIFITPPVNGWVLAVGIPLLFESDDHQTKRIVPLSKQFGEAQFFSSMRTSAAYLWARAVRGNVIRVFYEGDGTRREEGDKTDEEKQLGFRFFDASSPESTEPGYWQRKDLIHLNEDYVLKVAGKWSIDPSKLDQMGLPTLIGVIGSPSESYSPKPKWFNN
jgi:hypothetical protein